MFHHPLTADVRRLSPTERFSSEDGPLEFTNGEETSELSERRPDLLPREDILTRESSSERDSSDSEEDTDGAQEEELWSESSREDHATVVRLSEPTDGTVTTTDTEDTG